MSADALRKEELIKGVHLDIDCSLHCLVLERDVHLHTAIQMERPPVITPRGFVRLSEVSLPELGNKSKQLAPIMVMSVAIPSAGTPWTSTLCSELIDHSYLHLHGSASLSQSDSVHDSPNSLFVRQQSCIWCSGLPQWKHLLFGFEAFAIVEGGLPIEFLRGWSLVWPIDSLGLPDLR